MGDFVSDGPWQTAEQDAIVVHYGGQLCNSFAVGANIAAH